MVLKEKDKKLSDLRNKLELIGNKNSKQKFRGETLTKRQNKANKKNQGYKLFAYIRHILVSKPK